MKRSHFLQAIPIALSLAFISTYSASVLAAQDFVDIRVTGLSLDNGKNELYNKGVAGKWTNFECVWTLSMVNPEQYWEMKHPYSNKIPIRIIIDGVPKISDMTYVPYDLSMGGSKNALYEGCEYYVHGNQCEYAAGYVFRWTFKTTGRHNVQCVMNTPKMFSDRYSNDNSASLTVNVVPQNPLSPQHNMNETAAPNLIPFSHHSQKPNIKNPTQNVKRIPKRKPLGRVSQPVRRLNPDAP